VLLKCNVALYATRARAQQIDRLKIETA
jgi:hypothetical protein